MDNFSLPWVEDLYIKYVIPKYRYPGPIINKKLISIAHFNEYWYGEFLCHLISTSFVTKKIRYGWTQNKKYTKDRLHDNKVPIYNW